MTTFRISVTVDAVIFRKSEPDLEILLIKRMKSPFKDMWALPGGFVDENEDLEDAAKRELFEETGLQADSLEQLRAFGTPGRDPRQHTVSIAFTGFAKPEDSILAGDDASEADWFPINNLPAMAFDHYEIVKFALQKNQP